MDFSSTYNTNANSITLDLRRIYTRLLDASGPPGPPLTQNTFAFAFSSPLTITTILEATDYRYSKRKVLEAKEEAGESERKRLKQQHTVSDIPAPAPVERDEENSKKDETSEDEESSKTSGRILSAYVTRCGTASSTIKRAGKAKAMPFSFAMASRFYPNTLELIEGASDSIILDDDLKTWRKATKGKLAKGSPSIQYHTAEAWKDETLGITGYDSVEVNGKSLAVGGHVLIELNEVGNDCEVLSTAGFARIASIYRDEHEHDCAHVQWLIHGSSIFSILASTKELFFTYRCQEIRLNTIRDVVKVTYPTSKPTNCSSADAIAELEYPKGNYFCRQSFDETSKAITELPRGTIQPHTPGEHTCICCDRAAEQSKEKLTKVFGDIDDDTGLHFQSNGVHYREGDSVYIVDAGSKVLAIGQISLISAPQSRSKNSEGARTLDSDKIRLVVDMFGRYDDFLPSCSMEPQGTYTQRDERRLYCSGKRRTIDATELEGKCNVQAWFNFATEEDLSTFKDESNDNFWVSDEVSKESRPKGKSLPQIEDLVTLKRQSALSSGDHMEVREIPTKLRRPQEKKLRGLSVFSGAGGLDAGIEEKLGDQLEFIHAVELDEAACKTLKRNRPGCMISCADASRMLERAQLMENGIELEPLLDRESKVIPELPRRGEIDVIVGGPCCQGFSGANRSPNLEDPRNPLTITFLSYLEWYRPKWFLLENVMGFRNHRLGAIRGPDGKKQGGLPGGMVKLVRRILTGLGYQTHDAMLQAAHYRVPSTRPRFILWASLPAHRLPVFPQPQTASPPTTFGFGSTWFLSRRAAPHHTYTVGDALTDLKLWEWENPNQDAKPPARNSMTTEASLQQPIEQFVVKQGAAFTGINAQSYASLPRTEFQRSMRKGAHEDVYNHVTRCAYTHIERVCNIPSAPNVDHMNLPENLKTDAMRDGKYDALKDRRYRRLNIDQVFQACLTALDPMGKDSRCLHPFLQRIITVREYARAMSFPDWYFFDLDEISVEEALRQIGNAVPYNFARALGQGLREVILSSDTTNSGLPTPTRDTYRFGDQNSANIEISDDTVAGTESDETSKSEAEEPRDDSLNDSEDAEETTEYIEPRLQSLNVTDTADKTSNSGKDTPEDLEHQNQNPEIEIDLSHHHNEKTGFSIQPSSESQDYEAVFLAWSDDEDCDDENFGDEKEN